MKLAFTGDIMLSRNVGKRFLTSDGVDGTSIVSKELTSLLSSHDYAIGNMENPVIYKYSDSDLINPAGFCASPDMLRYVDMFDVFTLANNHIFDQGKESAVETRFLLKENGFQAFGFIENDELESITLKASVEVGLLACAMDYCIKNDSDISPHIADINGPIVLEKVAKLKSQNKLVIVLVHGGEEMVSLPEPKFIQLCRALIDAGADAVVTHHPHVVGCREEYKGRYIFYGLGDFIFDGESYLRRQGLILTLTIDESGGLTDSLTFTNITKNLKVVRANRFSFYYRITKILIKSAILKLGFYSRIYPFIYTVLFLRFQVSRVFFKLLNKGPRHLFRFILSKKHLLRFYLNKIIQFNK